MMIRSKVWNRELPRERLLLFFVPAAIVALLIGGVIGMLPASTWGLFIGVIIIALVLLLQQNELIVVIILAIQIYVDFYLAHRLVSVIMIPVVLWILFLARSPQRPWIEPRGIWLWALFLALTIGPAIRGALTNHDASIYYPNIIFGAFVVFWLGTVIGRDLVSVRRLFQILAGLSILIAVHTIIQATTGVTLLGAAIQEDFLKTVGNYQLGEGLGISRVGSFFVDPNWNGAFLTTMLFIPLGLFIESSVLWQKIIYLVGMLLILSALLYTFSAGAWVAALVGVVVLIVLAGRTQYRIHIPLFIIGAATVLLVGFPGQVHLLLQHGGDPQELMLRNAGWQTALRVIQAFPLTGVGFGQLAYLQAAEPYRVLGQVLPLDHPHDSYLEFAAMAGIPVLLNFLALLSFSLWQALQNWAHADPRGRSLLAAGIASVVALSFNSITINAWTLAPLAMTGWLILGVISSPLLRESHNSEMTQSNILVKNTL